MSDQLLNSLLTALNLDKDTQSCISALIDEASIHRSPHWAAHMTPNVEQTSILGKVIAAYHSGNLLSANLYPNLKQVEQQTLQWLSDKFHFNYGYITAGSSYGNLEALWQARDCHTHSRYVYGSHLCHYSIQKACDILGLTFIGIETDTLGRIDVESLQRHCEQKPPAAIVLNFGTTSNGVLDPIEQCVAIAKKVGAWCHIDAAWGGCLAFLDEFQHVVTSMSNADSLCFDPHKALSQPKPSGIIFYQSPRAKLTIDAHYLNEPPEKSISGSLGGELFLPLWLSLKAHGEQYFADEIKYRLNQARLFTKGLDKDKFWVHCSETGIVCFSAKQAQNLAPLVDSGVFSTTLVNGKQCYRAVFSSRSKSAESLILKLRDLL